MRQLLRTLLLITLSLCVKIGSNAQSVVYSTDFSTGMPNGWSVEKANASDTVQWYISASGLYSITPYCGNAYASIYSVYAQDKVKLVTNFMNISSLQSSILKFNLIQPSFANGDFDTLRLYYRTAQTDPWLLMEQFPIAMNAWSAQEVSLVGTTNNTLQLAFEYNYGRGKGIGIDCVSIESQGDCTTPTNTNTYNVTYNSASINAAVTINAQSHHVKVSTTQITNFNATANVLDTVVSFLPIHLQNLNPQTTYYYYLSSNCDYGLQSNWSTQTSFRTLCNEIDLPYTENFDYTTINFPDCWYNVNSQNSKPTLSRTNHTYNGSRSLNFYTYGRFQDPDTWSYYYDYNLIASSEINIDSISKVTLSFYATSVTSGSTIEVGVTSSVSDETTFVPIRTYTISRAHAWEFVEVDFSAYQGTGKHIAFRTGGLTTPNSISIDDLLIQVNRNCGKVKNLSNSNTTNHSTRLQWQVVGNANTLYNIKVSTTPIDPETQNGNVTNRTDEQDNYVFINNLTPQTDYYCYVQALCENDVYGYWSEPFKFTTLCSGQPLPYYTNFNEVSINELPDCWSHNVEITGSFLEPQFVPYVTKNISQGTDSMSLFMRAVSGSNGVNTMAILPQFYHDLRNVTLRFKTLPSTYSIKVGIMPDVNDASSFELVQTINLRQSNDNLVSFAYYEGAPGAIAFRLEESGINITEVWVDTLVTCQAASQISYDQITPYGADIHWVPTNPTDTLWQIQCVRAGNVSNILFDTITLFDLDTIVYGTTATITGLDPTTTYFYNVRPVCSASAYGNYFNGTATLRTGCDRKNLPFREQFLQGNNNDPVPECWHGNPSNSLEGYERLKTSPVLYGNASLSLASSSYFCTIVSLPLMDIDSVKHLSLSFSALSNSANGGIQIGVMTDPNDMYSFDTLASFYFPIPNVWNNVSFSFENYTGMGQYLAVMSDGTLQDYNGSLFLDDFFVEDNSGCKRPNNLKAPLISYDQVLLSWESVSEEQHWQVAYGRQGVNVDTVSTFIEVTDTFAVVSNLQPAIAYDFYVRTLCTNPNETSIWRGPFTVTTSQLPDTIPFVINFEDEEHGWTFLHDGKINQFVIGNATAASGTKSLYVSADLGQTNSYAGNLTSIIYAYREIYINPGQYHVSYFWQGLGNYFNWGRLFIVPKVIEPLPGVNLFTTNSSALGWIPLDGNVALTNQAGWINRTDTIYVETPGVYRLLACWRGSSVSPVSPSFSLDSIEISLVECHKPVLVADTITATSVSLHWYSDADTIRMLSSSIQLSMGALDTIQADRFNMSFTGSQVTISSLTPGTTYYFYVQARCGGNGRSEWIEKVVTTDCLAIPISDTQSYRQNFEQQTNLPTCWRGYSTLAGNPYPLIEQSTIGTVGNKSLSILSYRNSSTYVVLPRFSGTPINQLQLTFTSKRDYNFVNCYVGVMSDPEDINTFEPLGTIANALTNNSFHFSDYSGQGTYIAIMVDAPINGPTTQQVLIDDLMVAKDNGCSYVMENNQVLYETQVTPSQNSFRLVWFDDYSQREWDIATGGVGFNPDTVTPFHATYYIQTISGLQPGTNYEYYIRHSCSATNKGPWIGPYTVTTLQHPDSVPFRESFEEASSQWSIFSNYYDNEFTIGTEVAHHGSKALYVATGANRHYNATANMPSFAYAFRTILIPAGRYKASYFYRYMEQSNNDRIKLFLVPEAQPFSYSESMFNANNEPTAWVRLTPNGSFNTSDWQRYEGDVVITHGGHYQLLVAWKDNARAINNNPLAVDSITIAPKVAYHVYDTICQDQRYNGYGFTLYPTETTQGGVISRGRYVTSATNPDSFLVLNLMVTPTVINYIYDSICTGEVYTKYGFTESQTGTYTRNYITRHGCDSSVVLELTVNPIVTNIQNDGACQSDMPFEWRGRTITKPGNYTDTLVATTGCDSLIMLSFAIYPEYEEHETHAIYQSELPYTHLDTTFQTNTPVGNTSVVLHRTTQFGCDSIVHFTLMVVKDTKVEEMMNTDFTLYPNPIALNQEVMINSTVYQGAFTIEVVNSASQVVYTKQYEQCPVRLNCFHTSGVYLIRLITADQKQYHFKLMVK